MNKGLGKTEAPAHSEREPLPEVHRPDYQEQGEAESTEKRNGVEQIHTWSLKPVHLSASDLFRGTASGAAVAGKHLLGSGLHLICLLVRHRFMVNGYLWCVN